MPQEIPKLLLQRWHSLCGVLPLVLFSLLHLGLQATALSGGPAHRWVSQITSSWVWLLGLGVLLYAPLMLHCGYALWLSFSRPRPTSESKEPRFQLQLIVGISGLGVLAFLGAHWLHFRYPLITGELQPTDLYAELCESLSSTTPQGIPLIALGYVLGLAATWLHMHYGIASFLAGFETPDDPVRLRQVALARRVSYGLSCAGFALGVAIVVELATGSWVLGRW